MRQVSLLGKIPLLTSQWDEFTANKQAIVDLCMQLDVPDTVESNVAPNAKSKLWESKFDFLEQHQPMSALKLWLMQETTELINNFNNSSYKAIITESWAHVTRSGGYHKPHQHNNSTWSGIFHIDTEFNKGGSNNWYLPYYMERKPGLEFADDRFTINCTPGTLIVFPSMLLHDADTYYGDLPRIAIAFNCICL